MFFSLPRTNFISSVTFILSSAVALNLDQCRIVLFCKLAKSHTVCFLSLLLILFKLFPNKPWFLCVCSTSPLKTLWEKEKFLFTSNSSFSHSVFYPFRKLSAVFIKFETVICKPFRFGTVKNMSFGKRLTLS